MSKQTIFLVVFVAIFIYSLVPYKRCIFWSRKKDWQPCDKAIPWVGFGMGFAFMPCVYAIISLHLEGRGLTICDWASLISASIAIVSSLIARKLLKK